MNIEITTTEIKNISFYSFTTTDRAFLTFEDKGGTKVQIQLTNEMVKYLQTQIEEDYLINLAKFMKEIQTTK